MAASKHYLFAEPASTEAQKTSQFDDNFSKIERGRTIVLLAGEAINQYQVVYEKASDGKWWKATDANLRPFAIAAATVASGASLIAQVEGVVTDGAWTWSVGFVYADPSTAGALTQTPPSSGLPIGFAISATEVFLLQLGAPDIDAYAITLVVPADPGAANMVSVQVVAPRTGTITASYSTCRTAAATGTYTYNVTKNGSRIWTSNKPTRVNADGTGKKTNTNPNTVAVAAGDVFAVDVEAAGTGIADAVQILIVQ